MLVQSDDKSTLQVLKGAAEFRPFSLIRAEGSRHDHRSQNHRKGLLDSNIVRDASNKSTNTQKYKCLTVYFNKI